MKSSIKILFFHHVTSNFVNQDAQILTSKYDVKTSLFKQKIIFDLLLSFIKQLYLIFKNPKRNIIYVSQFASYHSWLPSVLGRLFSIPHVIFLHGADVNMISSINYGHNRKVPLKWFNKSSLRLASHLAPVSSHLIESKYSYIPNEPVNQGLIPLLGNRNLNISVIPNGIEVDTFKNLYLQRVKNSFLVVCSGAENERRSLLKGLDLVKQLAVKMPDLIFTIVGYNANKETADYPKNVNLYPNLAAEELVEKYNSHQFFLQLSLIESFGMALCEAMLCGCVPIVSDIPALIDVVNDQGYVLKRKDPELLFTLVQKAIKEYDKSKLPSTDYIKEKYSISQRNIKIKSLFQSMEEFT